MPHLTLVLLSSPRFKAWALANARRQSDRVVVVLNSAPIEEFDVLDPDVTWLESKPGKPNALAVAGKWLQEHAPDALVIQHDQDDFYPAGSAELKLEALRNADVVGSPVRRVWLEEGNQSLRTDKPLADYWHTWGGSYAWRASAFVPTYGPSKMFDDVYWLDAMVKAGARFQAYETIDTYCRWSRHKHVWCLRDEDLRSALNVQSADHDPSIMAEAVRVGAATPGQSSLSIKDLSLLVGQSTSQPPETLEDMTAEDSS